MELTADQLRDLELVLYQLYTLLLKLDNLDTIASKEYLTEMHDRLDKVIAKHKEEIT